MTEEFDDDDKELHGGDPEVAALLREIKASIERSESLPPEPAQASEPRPAERALPKQAVVGGFAFFLSLAAILPTGLIVSSLALSLLSTESIGIAGVFACASLVGALCAHFFIKGHISVLIHEFKHSLISNLVGNKRKGMKIDRDSGYFEYAYSKETKHFNAFISVAPYIVPVFTFVAGLIAFALFRHEHMLATLVVGIGYGMDLVLNIRDISPIQTDLNLLRGGYRLGVLYVTAWNVLIFGLLLAWVLKGGAGLAHILESISIFFVEVHQWYSQIGAPEE
jgi:hypothetical protein